MRVESVSCNNCGAPLEVGVGTNYVTCGHCGSRLAVKRTGSSAYTELLEEIDQKTDTMARHLAELRHHAELERIDREWEQERQGFLTADKHGNKHEPTTEGALLGGVVLIGFGLFFAITSGSMGAPFFFPLVGLGFAGYGVYLLVTGPAKAREFLRAREAYHRRRAEVTPDQFLPRDDEPPASNT
jgi:DNA-directed RNA polymerase subunit RPC12/RpoP